MKTLTESLIQSLNEGSNEWTAAFNHEEPNDVIFVKNVKNGSKLENYLEDHYDFVINIDNPSGLLLCAQNDEDLIPYDLKQSNINSLKSAIAKQAKTFIDGVLSDPNWEVEAMHYDEIDFEIGEYSGQISLNTRNASDFKNLDPKKLADQWIEWIKDSEIDGDSGYGYYLLDLRKGEVIMNGSPEVLIYQNPSELEERIKSI